MTSSDREEKALRFLGLAARAGRVVVGVPLICTALQKGGGGKPLAVLAASDGSENTKKRISDRTAYYGVPLIRLAADCATLALRVGKRDGAVAAVAVTEPGLARAITELYDQ
ncbi:MAG: ribosomal L7Ae/L30e/S12e/Gadd45 family protein [Clostridia bacterium]|nr:ribosomal L7Ae/L30e/S12e/Gadd45 family protein [Clostridia bacterium]